MKVTRYQFDRNQGWDNPPDFSLDDTSTLIIVFGSPEILLHTDVLTYLEENFPQSILAGCSTAGEIFGEEVYRNTVSVLIICFDQVRLQQTLTRFDSIDDSFTTGVQIGNTLDSSDLRAVLVFSDGLATNGNELARGLNDSLTPAVIIAGGLAADSDRFSETFVIAKGFCGNKHVVAIGLYGDNLRVGAGAKGGWDIFGPERIVTSSNGNIVYEMDGSPALQLYKNYLGELASELPASGLLFPLGVKNATDDEPVVRTIVAIDEQEGALIFAGDIAEGSTARLMQASPERLISGAEQAAEMAIDQLGENVQPQAAIIVSCFGRRMVLQQRTDEELEAVSNAFGDQCVIIGFYSYGELSSTGCANCDLHNQTLTLLVMAEV